MSEVGKESVAVSQAETTYITSIQVPQNVVQMQAATQSQQTLVPQSSSQVQAQGMAQTTGMAQVMAQGPQNAQSPHGVAASMPQQSPQYYVQASIASAMQGPPAIAPAPGPQTSTTTVSALHQPLQHHLAHQSLAHPGVSQSPMPQYPQQVQVIQSGIPGGPYLQQLYQNAQGHLLMPIQPHGMNTQLQQGTLNSLNSSIQVITAAGKPFQGQLGPHMITSTGGKPGVLQSGQASYTHAGNPNSGGQTVLIGQLGGQLGVISSQNPNIMNAQQAGQKPGDMHKVNNMQTFQQGIAWATPGSIHSPTILQNQPIFIRGHQPGQENNLYIQSAPQQQAMISQNCTTAMVSSIAAMPAQNQQNKPRTGMEMQTNIQPKVSMRPHNILPSMTTTQIRPGSSVSTQTASGQSTAQSQMGNQRSQGKVRGKNAAHRTSPAINAQHQINVSQMLQNQQTTTISISGGPNPNQLTTILPTSHAVTATVASPVPKQLSQVPQAENYNNMAQPKPGTPVHPPTAPIQPSTPGSRMAKGSPSTSPLVSSSQVNVSAAMLTAMTAPMPISTQTTMSPVPIIPSSHSNDVVTVTSSCATQMLPTSTYANATQSVTASYSSHDSNFSHSGKLTTTVTSLPVTTATTSRLADTPTNKSESSTNSPSLQQETNGQTTGMNHVYSLPLASSSVSGSGATINSTTNTEDNITNGVSPQKNGKLPSTDKPVSNSSGPPKAMVKPQVMTHVIEGYVIHEASEPFPVNRSLLMTDLNKVRSSNASNTATVLPQGNLAHEKEEDSEHAKCEVCGKTDLRSKFKKKRFCSVACASKRGVNKTGVPKRGIEPYKGPEDQSPKRFKGANKTEHEHDEYDSNNGTSGESSHDVKDEQDSFKTQKVDILKWTVRDVVEFIRNVAGCQDYAEDFEIQEIDGQALMLLKADHLMTAMSMKLGPALKICSKIEGMKGDKKET